MVSKKNPPFLLKRFIHPHFIGGFVLILGFILTFFFIVLTGGVLGDFFKGLRGTPWYYAIPMIIQVLALVFLVRRIIIYKLKGLELLLGFIITITLIFLFEIIDYKYLGDGIYERSGGFLIKFADVLFPLAIIFLYLHVEGMTNNTPNLVRAILVLGTGIPLIIVSFLMFLVDVKTPFTNQEYRKELYDLVQTYFLVFTLSIILVGIFGMVVMYSVFYHADTIDVEVPSLLTLTAVDIIFLSFVIRPFFDQFQLTVQGTTMTVNVYNTWVFSFGILFLVLTYVFYPLYTFALPFSVYDVILVTQEGVTLWHKKISHPARQYLSDQAPEDASLKSPAILAIATLVREVAQAQGELRLISLSDRHIIIESHKEAVGIVIADKTSFFLKRALKNFVSDAYNLHKKDFENFLGNVSVFKDCDEILFQNFTFAHPIEE